AVAIAEQLERDARFFGGVVDAVDDAAGVPVMSEIPDHVRHQRQANRAPGMAVVIVVEVNGRACARADERADSRTAFDPAVALEVIERSADGGAAELGNSRQFV